MAVEIGPTSKEGIRAQVVEVLKACFDPEIPVNIYDLGLIYEVAVEEAGKVRVVMTLTSPACPVAGSLPGEVEERVKGIAGVATVVVDVVWDPPWSPDLMTEAAKLELNML
ncbi:MAG: DUF59 domain-containing protein [Deltaproteobacteria bacterium]|nr:DUF59 domain-containing protein [Deltaproteobacteria bacterium]